MKINLQNENGLQLLEAFGVLSMFDKYPGITTRKVRGSQYNTSWDNVQSCLTKELKNGKIN